jgi:hypothetical protein
MHHVAIMTKSWKFIPKIIAGEKTIESRWYQTRRVPWDSIAPGDTVYFKNSGEPITASADVVRVLQFPLKSLTDARAITTKYSKQICLVNNDPKTWSRQPKYCILIFLKNPHAIAKPFHINKKGFGSAAAWLTVKHINQIKMI